MARRPEVEIVSTKGKGWLLAGGIMMGIGAMGALGGNVSDGFSMIMFGGMVFAVGKAIRWWVAP